MNYTADIDEIIAKYLTGEITLEEQSRLDQWMAESAENQQYLKQMERIWRQSDLAKSSLPQELNVEAALAKTKSKIKALDSKGKAKVIVMNRWWYGLAATLILIAGAFWFFQTNADTSQSVLASNEKTQRDTLVDGSVVTLNQYSSLSTRFSKRGRQVKMQGEAYFEVAHDTEKPFVVEIKQVAVTVVGTKFNIDGRSDSNKVIVSVEEGKVKVQSGGETIYLVAGEQATIDCQDGKMERKLLLPSGNVSAWANRQFVFDDVPLSEVIPILEKTYGTPIVLTNKALEKCRLHIRFNNEPIERVLMLISETFSLEITQVNGSYFLDGSACE